MQSQAENDGDHPGRGEQTAYRHVEHVGDDPHDGAAINNAGAEILQKLRFHGPPLEHKDGADDAGQQPRRGQPPHDFECAGDDVGDVRIHHGRRLERYHPGNEEHHREACDRGKLAEELPDRTIAKGKTRHQEARHEDARRNNQRMRDP